MTAPPTFDASGMGRVLPAVAVLLVLLAIVVAVEVAR
jgi:hypothetical protein